MAIETRLRETGKNVGGGGGSSSNSGGLAGTGGLLVVWSDNSVLFPNSKILTQGANITITTSATAITIASNTGGASNSAGLLGTGGFFILGSANAQMPNSSVIQAGSSVSFNYTGSSLFISAITGAGATSAGLAGTGAFFFLQSGNASLPNAVVMKSGQQAYFQLLPQQAKLYSNTSAARIDAGTCTWRLLFSSTTQQFGEFQFVMPMDYGSAPLIRLLFGADSTAASAQSAFWKIDTWGINPGGAGSFGYIDTFGGINTGFLNLANPWTAGNLVMLTVPLVNTVSFAANNLIQIRISGSGGPVFGNQELYGATFEYMKQ